ncbi:MAG TPA: MBL fold metallo-hydrolase, partial [Candidatus Marinimicrobia bacterium]|nr:MBL fold metallo-hydrolase [Candidatus Neomarinimicrobiota bacterium]
EKELDIFNSAKNIAQYLGIQNFQLPEVTMLLSDGQVLEVNSMHLQVLHTPGHTPGSVCYITDKHLFAGDTLFRGSVGRIDLPGGSLNQLNESLLRLSQLDPDIIVYPGHGETTSITEELKSNPFLKDLL